MLMAIFRTAAVGSLNVVLARQVYQSRPVAFRAEPVLAEAFARAGLGVELS